MVLGLGEIVGSVTLQSGTAGGFGLQTILDRVGDHPRDDPDNFQS